jgi:predicted N-formylglutamate amidohydrolase
MQYKAPFATLREATDSRVLLVGDHASNAVPSEFGTLGLDAPSFVRHIAYDPGVVEVVAELSSTLRARAVVAGFSRLVIDPNRGEDDPTLIMRLSDGEIIPGNAKIDAAETARRLDTYHRPYHGAIDRALDGIIAVGNAPLLISIHSFTPVWRGRGRPWHCGILWAGDPATARLCLAFLRREPGLVVGDNEPYSGELEGDCMDRHGTRRGLDHVLIELRQDLIASAEGRAAWVARLKALVSYLLERTAQEA